MSGTRRWRELAKRIPPVYWFAGLWRYLGFRAQLARANRIDAGSPDANLPPPILRYRVHRAFDAESYLQNGQTIARCLVDALNAHGVDLKHMVVLDFACGPGRVISELAGATESCALHGSDIDAEAIAWATENLSSLAEFSTNTTSAPTDYPDAMFDVIYSVSLFTHLNAAAQDEWLAEMQRLLKPDGTLLVTTHGRFTLDSCTPAERATLQRDGIVYRTDHKGRFKVDGLPDFYQTTFHTVDYVRRHWGRYFSIVQHIEGGLNGHQDMVLMRKLAAAGKQPET